MAKGKAKAESNTLKKADVENFLTVEEAANELGLKPTVIRNYLSDGTLTAYKFKTLTLLKADEVKERKERQKARK